MCHGLYEFGINLGIAFQIQDDLLDAFGDSNKVGKQVGGDILADKKTYLLLKAKELANAELEQRLLDSSKLSGDDKVNEVKAIMNEVQIPSLAKQEIDNYYAAALNELSRVNVSDEKKAPLLALAAFLMQRDH